MLIGKVLGELTLDQTLPEAGTLRWVRVRTDRDNEIAALDRVGVKQGDTVLMCVGDGAWRGCQCCPVDTVVVGTLDGNNG